MALTTLPATEADAGRGRPWLVLLGLVMIMADGFDLQAIGFVAPEIARAWNVDLARFGIVFSAGLVGTMGGALLAGPGVRRFGTVATLVVTLAAFGGLTFASTFSPSIPVLAVLRFLIGAGLGAALPLIMIIVVQQSPPRFRATALMVAMCGQPIGAVAGAALCGHFMPIYGWQFAFWLGGLVPLLLAAAVLASRGAIAGCGSEGAQAARETGRVADLFSAPFLKRTLLLWLVALCGVFMLYMIVNWLPGSVRAQGYSLQVSVAAIGLFNIGGIVSAVLIGLFMDRIGLFRTIGPIFAVSPIILALLDVAHRSEASVLFVSLLAGIFGYGAMISLGSVVTFLYPPFVRATGIGWTLGIGRLGAALGPLAATSMLSFGVGITRLYYLGAVAALVAAIAILLLGRETERAAMD